MEIISSAALKYRAARCLDHSADFGPLGGRANYAVNIAAPFNGPLLLTHDFGPRHVGAYIR